MIKNLISADLTFVASFCNDWPILQIEANRQTVYTGRIEQTATISFSFEATADNLITIKYTNKRNGPDVWDTVIDQSGNILQDQHAVLTGVRLNGARCDWVIDSMIWNYADGRQKHNRGFMDLIGHMDMNFPQDVFEWIIEHRKSTATTSNKKSSLDYSEIYVAQHESKLSLALIQEIKEMIKQINV